MWAAAIQAAATSFSSVPLPNIPKDTEARADLIVGLACTILGKVRAADKIVEIWLPGDEVERDPEFRMLGGA